MLYHITSSLEGKRCLSRLCFIFSYVHFVLRKTFLVDNIFHFSLFKKKISIFVRQLSICKRHMTPNQNVLDFINLVIHLNKNIHIYISEINLIVSKLKSTDSKIENNSIRHLLLS